jgi:hypothetical protein
MACLWGLSLLKFAKLQKRSVCQIEPESAATMDVGHYGAAVSASKHQYHTTPMNVPVPAAMCLPVPNEPAEIVLPLLDNYVTAVGVRLQVVKNI